jgi:23S rRNA (pseudouridine1915-N3)-methyltransferase
LKSYADVSITEIKEEKGKDIRRIVEKEGERILKLQIPYMLFDEKGEVFSSVEFERLLRNKGNSFNFVLGGAYGVSERVKEMAQDCIALSKMTFTHEMSRLFLLEQMYRAFTIMNKRGYHH